MTIATTNPVTLVRVVNSVGLAGLAVGFDTGVQNLSSFLGGKLKGNAHQDQAGVLLIRQGHDAAALDLEFEVVRDLDQPDFQYPFCVAIFQPFVQITFTNGPAASTFFRAFAAVVPL